MYAYHNVNTLTPKSDIDWETSTFGLLWVMEGSSAHAVNVITGKQGEPAATFLSDHSALLECTWTGYVRKTFAGKAVTLNSVAGHGYWTFTALQYTGLVAATKVVGGILFWDTGGADSTRRPLMYFDNGPPPAGPFPILTGPDVYIPSLEGGSVWFGQNV